MDATDAKIFSEGISDNGAMTGLNLANNMIGRLSCPEGWETTESGGRQYFKSATQSWTTDPPPGAKPEGVIALANALPDIGAMTSLNLASNNLGADGAKIIAGAIKVNKCSFGTIFMSI